MDLAATVDHLLALNRDAMAARHYDVAYHLLEAALCCADGLGDEARVTDVIRLAREQGAWIDAHDPDHRLSSRNATLRGNSTVFESCARTGEAVLARLHAEQLQQRLAGGPG